MEWMPTFQGVLDSVVADFIIRLFWFAAAYWFAEKMRMQHYFSFPVVLLIGVATYGVLMFAWNQTRSAFRNNGGYDRSIPARSSREGVEGGFEKATVVWFASIAGARIAQFTPEERAKIDRVLLVEPHSELMNILAKVQGERGDHFSEEVKKAVRFCKSEEVTKEKKGSVIEVRLSSAPFLNVILFDPGTPHAWARVQEFIPYYRGPGALVYAIRKEEWKDVYDRIESSFVEAWQNGKDPEDIRWP